MTLINAIPSIILGILTESWSLFEEAAPYLFLGFVVAGLLHALVPDEKILKYLGKSAGKFRSAFNASLIGIPLPLCSCGVVPTALSLKNRGATKGATLSFLISTPETGVDSIAITYALLDPIMTVFRPIASMTTALFTGIAENIMGEKRDSKRSLFSSENGSIALMQAPTCSDSSCSCHSGTVPDEDASLFTKIKEALKYSFVELLGDISGWLMVGILIAGIISYAIPDEFVGNYLGGGVFSMILMLVIGIPLYICATASTPLAAALVSKGMSPGTAFVFLLAGPATNAATITMVTKFLGKRSAALYLIMIAVCSLAFGLLLDVIYFRLGIKASSIVGSASEVLDPWIKTAFALLLIPFIIHGIYKQRKLKKGKTSSSSMV
ncbi:SO_0444 family Cu/Zn efflux transporter [Methanolobus sediminis]|uniref:SO_0444 family Cu/Zn efflux transporter n=1 Tax=Methanolobus sediminis TaxID=3072978 RepID=A0AA51UI85_9EURY|nr:SO_0444 family Cu/Zn efflux transporter [Methanolobus sediminis]WMW23992.1 SO_0444 family Cu/Zn efflux transporter [Methanolobus sediminis]